MSSSNSCDGSNKVLPQIRCTARLEPQDQECMPRKGAVDDMATEPAVLPDDVLVEVLAPHNLATCRWVCKAWRDIVHDHLRSRLLSRSVRGIFINYTSYPISEFYSCPSTGPAICGGLDFLPGYGVMVMDHCSGLLLCSNWKHKYKEIVFLNVSLDGAVAYNWSSSKFQYLGRILPKYYRENAMQCAGIDTCFPYTPCWMYEFPSTGSEDEQLSAGYSSESEVEDNQPFTYSVAAHEYELRKLRRRVKRDNDSIAKVRRRRRSAARSARSSFRLCSMSFLKQFGTL